MVYIVNMNFIIKIESVCVCGFSSEVCAAIENVIQGIVASLASKEAPAFTIEDRSSWKNMKWVFWIDAFMQCLSCQFEFP